MPSIYDIPSELGQNYIDYIMKQYQVWIDGIFGFENDNSAISAVDPFVFSGRVAFKVYGGWANTSGSYWVCTQNVNISANNDGDVLSGQSSFDRGGNYANSDPIISSWIGGQPFHCEMWGGYERTPVVNNHWYLRSLNYDNAEINANVFLKTPDNSNVFYSERPSITYNGYYTKVKEDGTGLLSGDAPILGIYSSNPSDATLGTPIVNVPSYSNTSYIWNVDGNSPDYHSTTYVTNQGDTITVQYSPYSVNTGTYGYDISYDDLYNIFTDIILPNIPQGNTLVVPTYDDVKYEDMGDFYIEPLHQYDSIPSAPTFDGTINLGDYPSVLAEGANTFLDFMPVTLSALFTAAFVACVLLRKLGR